MTDYVHDQVLLADAASFTRAPNSSVTVYDANDAAETTPLELRDLNGLAMSNPMVSSADAFTPAFIATSPQVKLVGGGLAVLSESYKGVRDEAVAAKTAAQAAAADAAAAIEMVQAPTDSQVDNGIARANIPGQIADIVPPLVDARVGESAAAQVPPLVAHAIATDSTIAAAASGAVGTALDGIDVLKAKDDRALRTVASPTYALPFTDKDGYAAGGVLTDGIFNFERGPKVQGQGNVTLSPVSEYLTDWAIPFADKDGYVAGGIRRDGTAEFSKLKLSPENALSVINDAIGFSRSRRDRVATAGDSLSAGFFGGTSLGQSADAYPAKLAAMLGDSVEVFNIASSGWTVDEISARIGALPMPMSAAGNVIPASGPVTVTTTAVIGWGTDGTRTYPGVLAGVPGTLVRNVASPNTFTFTRTAPGADVPLPAGAIYVPDFAGHDADTLVVMAGRNDVSQGIAGVHGSVANHIVAGIRNIVAFLSRDIKQVLVMSVTTNTLEVAGTAGHTTVTTANAMLAAEYGPKFLDLRRYLIDKAIYDLGITPTTEDLANMAADTLPPSIMDPGSTGNGDITHYSRATAQLVALQVFTYLTTRDWVQL